MSEHSTHRIPELWLVAGIPALTVAAGIATVLIASLSGSADAVILPVERTGPVQVLRDEADRSAAAMGLSARLILDEERRLLTVVLTPAREEPLRVLLAHPTRRSLDRRIELAPSGGGRYHALLPMPPAHHWNVLLESADGSWRLSGRLDPAIGEALLRPIVQSIVQ